jgi:hypothetical protein
MALLLSWSSCLCRIVGTLLVPKIRGVTLLHHCCSFLDLWKGLAQLKSMTPPSDAMRPCSDNRPVGRLLPRRAISNSTAPSNTTRHHHVAYPPHPSNLLLWTSMMCCPDNPDPLTPTVVAIVGDNHFLTTRRQLRCPHSYVTPTLCFSTTVDIFATAHLYHWWPAASSPSCHTTHPIARTHFITASLHPPYNTLSRRKWLGRKMFHWASWRVACYNINMIDRVKAFSI